MDEAAFWAIIDTSRMLANGELLGQIDELRACLEAMDAEEIASFDRTMMKLSAKANSWLLWGAAFVIWNGCSDDGFIDFRSWLISRGKLVYQTALEDPESLADAISSRNQVTRNQEFATLALDVWQAKTGGSIRDYVSTTKTTMVG